MAKQGPTIKQIRTAALLQTNGGNMSKAMRDAGYSPNTAKNPHKLVARPSWQELMETYLPDEDLLRALAEDIEAKPGNRIGELSLAARMKGKLTEKIDHTTAGKPITIVFDPAFNNEATPETEGGSTE